MAQVKEKPAQRRSISPFWLEIRWLVFLALAYGVAAGVGQSLITKPAGIPVVWPASGVALAFLLKNPKQRWVQMAITIYSVGLISYWISNHPLPVSLVFALINLTEALVSAFILHWLFKNKINHITFGRMADVFSLFAVSMTVSGLTAILGASVSALMLGAPFFETWQLWWVSDGLGILLFVPLVLIWMIDPTFRWRPTSKLIEAFALVALLILFSSLMFGLLTLTKQPVMLSYMLFPFLIWLAFRFSPRSMINALLLIAAIAIWGTWQNYGVFATQNNSRTEELISLQVFLGFSTFSGLFLSAIMTERKQAAETLRIAEANYRNILENAPIGFFQSYPESGYRHINSRMAQIFGFASPEEMLNSITDITRQIYTTPSPRQAFRREIAEHGWAVDFITQHRRKDGSPFWTSTNARAITNEEGQTLYYEGFIQDIDERIKSEKDLQESQQFVQSTMDSLSAHICVLEADGTILAVNKAWTDFARQNPPVTGNVSVGGNYLTVCDNTIGPEAQMARAFATGIRAVLAGERETFYQEYPCHAPNEQRWFMGRVLRFADETTNRVVIAHENITERKQSENALRESEASLKLSQEIANMGHWTWDTTANRVTFSDEIYRIFGLDSATFDGDLDTIIIESVHPEDREKVIQFRNMVFNEQKPMPIEHRIIRPDQSIRIIWAKAAKSTINDDGKIIRLNGILQDITERKQAEDALRESEASLKLSQQIAHLGHWTWDTITNHVTWSDEMYRIFGLNPAKFDGDLDKIILESVHPDDREKVIQANQAVITEEKSEPMEYRVIWPDQSVHTVWAEAGTNVTNANGKIIKLSGIVQDITERKRVEDALRESERFAISIANNIPSMLAYWTNDLHCIFANKEYLTWFGCTTTQMANISAEVLLGAELFKKIEPNMRAALQGEAQQFEHTLSKASGDVGYFWAQYTPHYVNKKIEGFFMLITDITQIKHDQQQLRISEEKWRGLFAILPVGISILNAERQIVDFNPALENILDITAQQLREGAYTHRTYLRADGSLMPANEFPSIRAVQEKTVIQSAQMGIVKENNQLIWVEMSAAPLALPDAACVIVTTDVTRRKHTEQALRDLNDSLSLAQRAANTGLWDWDMSLDYYNWSPELFELFGIDPTITPTLPIWLNSIHEQDRQRSAENLETAIREHLPINNEYRILLPSGEVRWINALGNTTYDDQGQPQRMAGICIDITSRKQIENALSESEARLKGIVVSAMDGIVMVDSSQHITLFNQSAEKMFGLAASSVIGQPLDFILPQDKHNLHKKHIEHFGETGITTRNMSALMNITATRANGENFPLEASISQFIVNGQKFYTAILRDITERKQMEENLRGSLQEKEALLKEVHHRVKNNLQIVSSLLSMQANSAKDEKVTHALEESKNRVRAMALIHEKLYRSENLEYIQAEEYIPELTNHLTGSLIGHERMGIKFDLQIAHITFDISKAIPCGMIITELVSNALKYAFKAGEPGIIKVHLTVEDDEGRVRLMVSDNGIGLPPEIDYTHPDTLGLELVSILSRQLKASLQVIREPGTTFILIFRN